MKTFIKAIEVWVPSKDRMGLIHGDGLYGPCVDLERVSRPMTFAPGEGLPGTAWAQRRPIVLKNLEVRYFKRVQAARAGGLTCGIALPIFAGEFLLAVAVFFCGDDEEHIGAIELWNNDPSRSSELGLLDGYYGTAEVFERDSRYIKFRPGFGLPGTVWQTGMPMIMDDLGKSTHFLRTESARQVGINRGLAIPCSAGDGQSYVMTFLSALGTPIARRFEVWAPTPAAAGEPGTLRFVSGRCDSGVDLEGAYQAVQIQRGVGILGQVAMTGVPAVSSDLAAARATESARSPAAGLKAIVAVPILAGGFLKSVVAWYL
jgi:hypothetical protein